MYSIMNMFFDQEHINIGGYRIVRVPNYTLQLQNTYRAASLIIQTDTTIPSNYGTHVKTADAEWRGEGNEAISIFWGENDEKVIWDILILNNLIGREQATIEGYELRKWHVRDSGFVYTEHPEENKEAIINVALRHIQTNPHSCLRALLWLMESWNTTLFETRLFLLRIAYEFLFERIPGELENFMSRLKSYIDSQHSDPLPSWWHPQKYLVIGRHCRNFVAHVGILSPTVTSSYGHTLEEGIKRECTNPHRTWQDGCPELISRIDNILASPDGFTKLTMNSLLYLDLLLYLFCIDYIGLDFTQVDGFIDYFALYIESLDWKSI